MGPSVNNTGKCPGWEHAAFRATKVNCIAQYQVLLSCYNFHINIKFTELSDIEQTFVIHALIKGQKSPSIKPGGVLKVTGW